MDRFACHKFHDDERNAFGGQSRIQEPGDVGMFQRRQNPPLVLESLHQAGTVKCRVDQFYRDVLFKLVVVAAAQVHDAHAATADNADQPVWAGSLSIKVFSSGVHRGPLLAIGHGIEKVAGLFVCPNESTHFGTERRIGCACGFNVRIALLRRQLERGCDGIVDLLPTLLDVHAHSPPAFSRRASHARATFHSRFTVAVEMPSTSDVSSMDRPPKNRSSTTRAFCSSKVSNSLSAS